MTLRIALLQFETFSADPAANAAAIGRLAREADAGLVLTPAMSIAGLMPGDLVRRADFRAACDAAIAQLAAAGGPALVVGAPWAEGGRLHDALFVLDGGRVVARRARHLVRPSEAYDAGPAPGPVALRGARLGLAAGEDALDAAVAETLAETGAELLLALAAAPFATGAAPRRLQAGVARVVETGLGLVFLNAVGGPDEAVCDGGSFVLNPDRALAAQMARFAPGGLSTAWQRGPEGLACSPTPLAPDCGPEEEIWRALVLGLRRVAGQRVLVELTEEAAPALVALLAVEALGAGAVHAVAPGALAARLGLAAAPDDRRGLLRLSAQDGTARRLGLGGGEGDLAPLGDLLRGEALALARWRNATHPAGSPIPEAMLGRRPPWLDGLPPDATLDPILDAVFHRGLGMAELAGAGHDPAAVAQVRRLLARGEAARRMAPPRILLRNTPLPRYPLPTQFTDPDA